jgi:predicted RNA-binding Zn-ribbon protein involved in translation (DUF1610 family)
MRYHQWCWIVRGIGLLGGIVLAAGMLNNNNMFLCLTGVAVLLIALAVSAAKLRCPACGKRIPEQVNMRIEVCPHCGKPL